MRLIRRFLYAILSVAIGNALVVINNFEVRGILYLLAGTFFFLIFCLININPISDKKLSFQTKVLIGGYELYIYALLGYISLISYTVYSAINYCDDWTNYVSLGISALIGGFIYFVIIMNGIIRILITSTQLKLLWKILLFFFWYLPILNFILIFVIYAVVRLEIMREKSRKELNDSRKENEVCKTKYPVILVHGVFFRDWQIFNYWGRIPGELIKNGAEIYYGNQQSAAKVEKSGNEIKEIIFEILNKSGAEKVNIIAHSKGGLDTRYAVSCLGMDRYVASLTTINTPHRGCKWVDKILKKVPEWLLKFVTKRYNSLFKRLGDKNPDFLNALMDLTSENCNNLNRIMEDKDGVVYQSFMSVMSKESSDGFPLNISYKLAEKSDGENDGLVGVESAKWGEFRSLISTKNKRGVSHGDVIDLKREDIKGFDVRELYVGILKELKEKGL